MDFGLIEQVGWMVGLSYYYLVGYVSILSIFIISLVVFIMLFQLLLHTGLSPVESESSFIEFIWTFVPSLFVLYLCYLNVGYIGISRGTGTYGGVKVIGHQWYWSYASSASDGVLYDSVISDFVDGVDKPLRLSLGKCYAFHVTSADVVHSFSVPFLGIKGDAVPGRINQLFYIADILGSHVGYCSELCGAGHAYMPIVVEVVMD